MGTRSTDAVAPRSIRRFLHRLGSKRERARAAARTELDEMSAEAGETAYVTALGEHARRQRWCRWWWRLATLPAAAGAAAWLADLGGSPAVWAGLALSWLSHVLALGRMRMAARALALLGSDARAVGPLAEAMVSALALPDDYHPKVTARDRLLELLPQLGEHYARVLTAASSA